MSPSSIQSGESLSAAAGSIAETGDANAYLIISWRYVAITLTDSVLAEGRARSALEIAATRGSVSSL